MHTTSITLRERLKQPAAQVAWANGGTARFTIKAARGGQPGLVRVSAGRMISFTGTLTKSDCFLGSLTIVDGAGAAGMRSFVLTINPSPAFTLATLPPGTLNAPYSPTIGRDRRHRRGDAQLLARHPLTRRPDYHTDIARERFMQDQRDANEPGHGQHRHDRDR
jgi:hypothetical protein